MAGGETLVLAMKGLLRKGERNFSHIAHPRSLQLNHRPPPPTVLHAASKTLVDTFNRNHTYLRISLTERCNLRCTYCMPPTLLASFSPPSSILTTSEILRLATLFVQEGVTKIRLTGGEPTIRKDIVPLVKELSNTLRPMGLKILAMTSNGVALRRKLPELVEGGLTHLNLSLDTLDPITFTKISHRPSGMHAAAVAALQTALSPSSALKSLKINMVVMADTNLHEVAAFAALTRDNAVTVRFIEYMPFSGTDWNSNQMVPSKKVLDRLRESYPGIAEVVSENATRGPRLLEHSTAKEYRIPGHKGFIGFISSMSDHFCAACTRLRITADGQLKVCLFDPREVSLRDMVRNESGSVSDERLLEVISAAVQRKKASHGGMDLLDRNKDANRSMIRIGLRVNRRRLHSGLLIRGSSLDHTGPWIRYHSITAPEFLPKTMAVTPNENDNHLSHIDAHGRPNMVDVSSKDVTSRRATAIGKISLNDLAFSSITTTPPPKDQPNEDEAAEIRGYKGAGKESTKALIPDMVEVQLSKARRKSGTPSNVLTVAQLAGIMAAKSTSTIIPLCHPLPLTRISVVLRVIEKEKAVECTATVQCDGKTGVEMEALTAVSVALLTVWDMLKKVGGKEMVIEGIKVIEKRGGQSGEFRRTD